MIGPEEKPPESAGPRLVESSPVRTDRGGWWTRINAAIVAVGAAVFGALVLVWLFAIGTDDSSPPPPGAEAPVVLLPDETVAADEATAAKAASGTMPLATTDPAIDADMEPRPSSVPVPALQEPAGLDPVAPANPSSTVVRLPPEELDSAPTVDDRPLATLLGGQPMIVSSEGGGSVWLVDGTRLDAGQSLPEGGTLVVVTLDELVLDVDGVLVRRVLVEPEYPEGR